MKKTKKLNLEVFQEEVDKKESKTFCSHLFTGLSLSQKGTARVCCNNYEVPKGVDGEELSFYSKDFNIRDVFNSDLHTRIRKNILAGKRDPSCIRCWQTEDNGAESYRTIWNSTLARDHLKTIMLESCNDDAYIKEPFITFLDFTVGNKCNLVCRMCNLENSNQWDLESDLLGIFPIWSNTSSTTLTVDKKFLSDEFFVQNFKHLRQVNFLGGEPLIIDEHYEFLRKCIKFNVAKRIILSYTTNLTVIKKELKELWEQFRHVSVGVSIDGVGDVNDYIRYPSTWKNVQKNIKKVSTFQKDISMTLQIHATFQLMNVLNWDKLLEWSFSIGELGFWRIPFSNWVSYPEWHDPRLLPKNLKDTAIKRINKFIDSKKDVEWEIGEEQWLGILRSNLITLKEDYKSKEEFGAIELVETIKEHTKLLDLNRGQHTKKYIPELEEFIYG